MGSTGKSDAPTPPCPSCGAAAAAKGEQGYPFCSERCRLIDLGRWLGEEYKVPALDDAPSVEDGEH